MCCRQDRTHEFTYIPAAGYGFQPAAGIVADFRFDVDVDGQVVVDPRYAGFATASGRTLTINGYRVTIDGRALSHDLLPLLLGWTGGALSNASTHELTLVPAVGGYTFLATDGSGNLFTLTLDIDGTVSVSPAGTGGLVAQTHDPIVRLQRPSLEAPPQLNYQVSWPMSRIISASILVRGGHRSYLQRPPLSMCVPHLFPSRSQTGSTISPLPSQTPS